MPPKQPDTTHVTRGDDGSVVIRWFHNAGDEWRRWYTQHPNFDRSEVHLLPPEFRWTSPTGGGWGPQRFLGELQVWFESAGGEHASALGRVASVRLTTAEDITPTVLQRFAWARMLTVAEAAARADREGQLNPQMTAAEWGHAIGKAFNKAWPDDRWKRRPGRHGRPDEFYRTVAEVYQELLAAGLRDPTNQIAQAVNYNRSTVAGWVSGARRRGYLPTARPGRPG